MQLPLKKNVNINPPISDQCREDVLCPFTDLLWEIISIVYVCVVLDFPLTYLDSTPTSMSETISKS